MRCPMSHLTGYDCELDEGHDGSHIATDIDGTSRVGWTPGKIGEYRRDEANVPGAAEMSAHPNIEDVKAQLDAVQASLEQSLANALAGSRERMAWEIFKTYQSNAALVEISVDSFAKMAFESADVFIAEAEKQRGTVRK